MSKIVGLIGYARVGKDTAAAALTERGWTRRAFADALKEQVANAFGPMPECDKSVWRPLLVEWGRLRRFYDQAYWIKQLGEICTKTVITDVRYLNEARYIKALGGTLVYIHRPYFGAANDEEHCTIEDILGAVEELDPVFVENVGTEEELRTALLVAVEGLE